MPDMSRDGEGRSRFHSPNHPDPHRKSALLLVESLIHTLVAKSILTLREAIEIVETAEGVELELPRTTNGATPILSRESPLASIAKSLRTGLDE